jgi:hypothetical protein
VAQKQARTVQNNAAAQQALATAAVAAAAIADDLWSRWQMWM